MRYLSVCSGIEAASCAWRQLGWEAVAFSEVDAFPSALLAHRYPSVPNHGDMTRFKDWPDATVDLLVGGTPCQSFSVAGLRKGLDDPRGNLMLTYLAIAARYRPRWLVWENVPGVLSSNSGRDFGALLGGLAQLGYGFAYRVLDAQYFGLAQRRKRVFVVGCLGDWRRAAAVLLERHSLSRDPAPRREAREGPPGRPARSVAIRGRNGTPQAELGGEIANALLTSSGGRGGIGIGAVMAPSLARCVTAGEGSRQDYETTTLVAHGLRGEGFDASEDGTGRGTPLVPVSFDTQQITSAANRTGVEPGMPTSTLAARSRMHVAAMAFHGSQDPSVSGDVTHPVGRNNGLEACMLHRSAVRRLTPRECERLQGFRDDYTLIPYGKRPAKDGPRYKAIGNSMAVPVMAWLGRRIQSVNDLRLAA